MPLLSLRLKVVTRIAVAVMVLWLVLLAMYAPLHRSERTLSREPSPPPSPLSAVEPSEATGPHLRSTRRDGGGSGSGGPRRIGDADTYRREVVEAIRHSWTAYETHAFGSDEFDPTRRRGVNWDKGPGIGVFLIDAMDTLHLSGMDDAVERCIAWVDRQRFDAAITVSLFETTIRGLGGLLSTFFFTDDERLRRAAVRLGDGLLRAFDTPTGIPDNYVNLASGAHHGAAWVSNAAILSELGSLQLEFLALSEITGNVTYDVVARRAVAAVAPSCKGLCPRLFSPGGAASGPVVGVGSFGDSFYEYALKNHLARGRADALYRSLWESSAAAIVAQSHRVGTALLPPVGGADMDHLSCFVGGLFALSYLADHRRDHLAYAEDVAQSCRRLYTATRTGLPPDTVRFQADGSMTVVFAKFILRPEFVETLMYLYRATHNDTYREWGHELLVACNTHLKVAAGYVGTQNVNAVPTVPTEYMETFWLAETLKYLLLLFDDAAVDLRGWVINTEGHPLRFRQYAGR